MTWFYVVNQERRGPFTDEQFQECVRTGQIASETLVWNETMPQWLPWAQVAGSVPPPSPAPTATPVAPAATPAAPAPASPGLVYAGFWQRAAARILDQILVTVLVFPLNAAAQAMLKITPDMLDPVANPEQFLANALTLMAVGVLLQAAIIVPYQTICIGTWGQTLGKRALGIAVVTPDGTRPSYLRALGRAAMELVLLNCVCCIGHLVMLLDAQKRTVHDFVCNTRVVIKR